MYALKRTDKIGFTEGTRPKVKISFQPPEILDRCVVPEAGRLLSTVRQNERATRSASARLDPGSDAVHLGRCRRTVGRPAAEGTIDFVVDPYRFEVLPGVGHFAADQSPDRVNELLLQHIAAHPV
jgi:hypothetical protein